MRLAAKNFLNMNGIDISKQVQDSLEGNMREVIGSLSLRDININRDKFSDEIMNKAQKDMEALGLRIISCNIQNVTDEKNLIEDLGADNTWTIRKQAKINKAIAERDIAMAEAQALKEANDAQVDSQTQIAIRQNELSVTPTLPTKSNARSSRKPSTPRPSMPKSSKPCASKCSPPKKSRSVRTNWPPR